MHVLGKINDTIERVMLVLATILGLVLVGIVLLDVSLRSFFNVPIMWGQEVALICFIWSVGFGSAVAFRKDSHFVMDLISSNVPPRTRLIMAVIATLALIGFALLLIIEGTNFAITGWKRFSRPSGMPLTFMFAVFPVLGATSLLIALEKLSLLQARWKEETAR